jgi:hypothetical protein
MEGLIGISIIGWIIAIIAAVMMFLLPFFVLRIRDELIKMNLINKRILVLLEAVIPESKKPEKPKTIVCNTCRTINEVGNSRCSHCGSKLST